MRERDPFGFITLHNGRAPIAQRIAHLLVMILSMVLFVQVMERPDTDSRVTEIARPSPDS